MQVCSTFICFFLPSQHITTALLAGEKRHKACELMSEIHARWQELDEDQRTIETHDVIEILTERREMKELATHNTMVHAFNDAQRTLEKIDREVRFISYSEIYITDDYI